MLHHPANTVDSLSQDPRGPPASGCIDLAPKMHDPFGDRDGHIQSFQTGVFTEPDQNAAPNGFVARCRVVWFCRVDDRQEIGAADDADEFAVPQDGNALDATVLHQRGDSGKRCILVDDNWIGRHDIAYSPPASLYKSVRPLIRPKPHIRLQDKGPARQFRSTD